MNATQKTWTDLLGKFCTSCSVLANTICQYEGNHGYSVLWTFDSPKQAQEAFSTWQKE